MNIKKNLKMIINCLFPYNKYYSQRGEDIIAWSFFSKCNEKMITYLDIGANDPKLRSNTYFFYKNSLGRGVLIEPNSDLCSKLHRYRREDIVLNCGVGVDDGVMTYYKFRSHTMNTFSIEDVERYLKNGFRIKSKESIKVISINRVMERYGCPDFLSVDVEGLDFEIIKAIDYSKYCPRLICIETYELCGGRRCDFDDISAFLSNKGYYIYADTNLNTLYAHP